MRYYGIGQINGLLADLGVSSHHFDDAERGFSFRFNAPLDMRMNKRSGMTAADIVNGYTEEGLADVMHVYGEIKQARKLASQIVRARVKEPMKTTGDLLKALGVTTVTDETGMCQPSPNQKKEMARLFQALRVEVNHEMDALRDLLQGATELIRKGGRLSIITYHSLEDRLVKNMMKAGNVEGQLQQDFFGRAEVPFRMIYSKVIVPTAEEQDRNPRSRSAKLRIAERV